MTDLLRKTEWLKNLNETIDQSKEKSFVWGEWDCALWAAESVKSITDIDFAKDFRGKYQDKESAALVLRKLGSGSLYNILRRYFGNPCHPAKAWRGDIAYYKKSLGICYGNYALFVGSEIFADGEETPDGLISISMANIQCVFRVR